MNLYIAIMFIVGCISTGYWFARVLIWLGTRMADSIADADERRHQANRQAQDVAAALAAHARKGR